MPAPKRSMSYALAVLLTAIFVLGCSAEARKSRLLKSADGYYQAGEYDKAKIEYLNVLKEDPKNPMAIQRLGLIWLEQGSPLQAARFLLATRELAPENLEARAKLVFVLIHAQRFEEARKETLTILDQSPMDQEALRLLVESSFKGEDLEDAERRLRSLNADGKPGLHLANVALFLKKGDLEAAEAQARQALSLDPDSAEAHFLMAKVLLARKDSAGAEAELQAAAKLAPARSPIRLAHAEFTLRRGEIDEARRLLNQIIREASDFLPAWRLLAQIALAQKKLDESLKFLDNVLLRDPANIEAQLLRAQVWLAQGRVNDAIQGLERLDASYPMVPAVKYQLARAYLQDKNPAQAAFALSQALAQDPDYVEAILLLAEIDLRSGSAQQVVTKMQELLKRQPSLIPAQILLAQAYQSLGRLDDAAAVFRDHIKTNPQSAPAHLWLGLVLKQQGKLDEARAAMEAAQKLAPGSSLAISQLVDLDLQAKDYDAALRRVGDQLQETPDSPDAHFLEGKIYAAKGSWDDAERALLKALEGRPADQQASALLVSVHLAAGKFPEAIALLEEELSDNPNDARALMSLAMIYERTKDFSKARATYEKLISLKPEQPFALNNLAYLYAEHLDLLDKAREPAQKARALRPDDPRIADTLGWILYKQGDYQQAVTLLEESARKLPHNPEVQFHLGMARYVMGQRESAKAAFLLATSAPNEFPGKDEAQRRLALLASVDGKPAELPIEELEAALAQQPNDPLAQMRLGEAYEKEGAFAKAADAYEEAIKLNPDLLAAAIKLAELNAGPLQASDKALQFARKARELAPNNPKVLAVLGKAAYQSGNFTWAYSLLQEAARQLPNDPNVLGDLAWAAYSQGKIADAQSSMQRVLEALPNSTQANDAKLFLATTALDDKEIDAPAAQPEVERILAENPNYVPALMVRARLSNQRGQAEAAAAIYGEVLRRFPDFAPAQKEVAAIYLSDPQKWDEAYNLALRARKSLSDDRQLARILAKLSYERDEFAYAVQLLKQSSEKGALNAEDLYYLGMSQFKSKDIVQARQALDQALAAGLSDPLASEAKRTLKSLDAND